jgi:hypothetical protein
MAKMKFDMRERFLKKVCRTSTCWLWTASCFKTGYGQFQKDGTMVSAHRMSFELFNGPIPKGMMVMHSCDVKKCVNPKHLSLGTAKDNVADAISKKRMLVGEKNGQAKLTVGDVLAIRSANLSSHTQLAAIFGVSRRLVGMIRRRERWVHL